MNMDSLLDSLSACSNLTDLKIVGVNVLLEPILELLARKCCLIEHLFLDNCYQGMITYPTIKLFVTNCLKITSLTLLDFRLNDAMAQILVTGFRILKYINLSNTAGITGSFLRNLGHRSNDSPLQTLILRDCFSLQEGTIENFREVVEFLNSLIAGNVRSIRYIDVSSNNGLACDGDRRTSKPKEAERRKIGYHICCGFSLHKTKLLEGLFWQLNGGLHGDVPDMVVVDLTPLKMIF
ncbi:unnamed protein product [Arabidopsis thaliana]|nr:unnamed protein product [Arabidopsis thaliana]